MDLRIYKFFSGLALLTANPAVAREIGRSVPSGATFNVVVESPSKADDDALRAGKLATLIVHFDANATDANPAPLPTFSNLRFDAGMPSHNHGMVVTPKITPISSTAFRIDGVRLHMPGVWQMGISVVAGERLLVVSIPLEVPKVGARASSSRR